MNRNLLLRRALEIQTIRGEKWMLQGLCFFLIHNDLLAAVVIQ